MEIKGKHISIIGAVRSGIGAARLAIRKGAIPFVSDSGSKQKLQKEMDILEAENISYEVEQHSSKVFDADLIVTSPGVPTNADVLIEAEQKNILVISELEFASWFCKGTVIAITGTNGKTTTTSLCAHTLNTAGYICHLAGNIGFAFSEIADQVQPNEYVALETSSFQIDHIKDFKPRFAVILNITPDHLDRYENKFENYIASKMMITKNQKDDDYFIYNFDDANIKLHESIEAKKIGFSLSNEKADTFISNNKFLFRLNDNEEVVCSLNDLSLKGEHNASNALAVLPIAKLIGCKNDHIKKAFSSFEGVEHRLEFVRELNGITFINDSKATNVDSVWYALRSFDKPILLILGGKDKGNDYNKIKDLVKLKVKKIYAIGSSANKVEIFFKEITDVQYVSSFDECTVAALKDAEKGDVVLLSPACASFDMFDNYEHRGREFKKAVNNLK